MNNKNMPGGRIRLPKCKEHNKPQHLCEKCIIATRVALRRQQLQKERELQQAVEQERVEKEASDEQKIPNNA